MLSICQLKAICNESLYTHKFKLLGYLSQDQQLMYTSKFQAYCLDMTVLKQNLEHKINRLLEFLPVVMLIGARQTGKTTLSKMLADRIIQIPAGCL
mgnify:CR=1 FL=1